MQRLRALKSQYSHRADDGFTLIELLVVVVIIGILLAIAIPLYLNYEKGARNKSAASDLRTAISTIEVCNSDNDALPASFTTTAPVSPCANESITVSNGTTLSYYASDKTYMLVSYQDNGSIWYCYNSSVGGSVITESGALPSGYGPC